MHTILRRKQAKPNAGSKARRQYSILTTSQTGHSFNETTQVRSVAIPGCQFGENISFILHSQQYVADCWLDIRLGAATAAANEYCKDVALKLVESFSLHYNGKEIQDTPNYEGLMYELMTGHLNKANEQRKEDQEEAEVAEDVGNDELERAEEPVRLHRVEQSKTRNRRPDSVQCI